MGNFENYSKSCGSFLDLFFLLSSCLFCGYFFFSCFVLCLFSLSFGRFRSKKSKAAVAVYFGCCCFFFFFFLLLPPTTTTKRTPPFFIGVFRLVRWYRLGSFFFCRESRQTEEMRFFFPFKRRFVFIYKCVCVWILRHRAPCHHRRRRIAPMNSSFAFFCLLLFLAPPSRSLRDV